MFITRRKFFRNACQLGKAGLFMIAGGSLLQNGCTFREEEEMGGNGTIEEKSGIARPGSEKNLDKKGVANFEPSYKRLEAEGKLKDRIEQAYDIMEDCSLCPRHCGINRLNGEIGFCTTGEKAVVYSHQPHFGEEAPLVGNNGSGTIFFSNCNLRCVFCQNWPIAHEGEGSEVEDEELADMMLDLQNRGCHNINLVTPTHVVPNILNATRIALKQGLEIPLCFNTSGYENVEQIQRLNDIVDIYLPDLKFMDGNESERYNEADARDYPEVTQEAIKEMHLQVGNLSTDERGVAKRGIVLRHLVMPNRVSGPKDFAYWVAENLDKDTYVNIMAQYRVEYNAFDYERISRAIEPEEFIEAIEWAKDAGLTNIDDRAMSQYHRYIS